MKKKLLLTVGIMALLASCSSSNVHTVPLTVSEPDYIVRERNYEPTPSWYADFSKWKTDNDGKGFIYFMGESGEVKDRISGCELSILMAKKKIAEQLAELVTTKIASQKDGNLMIDSHESDDQTIRQSFEAMMAQKSIGLLSGVEEHGVFWERRDYSKIKGNSRVFSCAVLVRISEKDFKTALAKTKEKAQEVPEKSEMKSLLGDAFKN